MTPTPFHFPFHFRLVILVLVLAGISMLLLLRGPDDGSYRFNFAPQDAPAVDSFIKISARSDYNRLSGYGWLDAAGAVETGAWHRAEAGGWEARANLNVISRETPDDLARSYAGGPATFALDVAPGSYEVWVLSGDAGYLEYVPHEPYHIEVEGVTAYAFTPTADEFYRDFETPVPADDLSQDDIWQRAVAPRFPWSRVRVEVPDGRLEVRVVAAPRAATVYDYIGDYANTEVRKGPGKRYSGALNALVVLPAALGDGAGEQVIAAIDAQRRQNFTDKWPLHTVAADSPADFTAHDHQRGYTVFPAHPQRPLQPGDRQAHLPVLLRLRATPGEYVPLTFGLCPLQDLGSTEVSFRWLPAAPGSGQADMPHEDGLSIGVVRYVARPTGREDHSWSPVPGMIVPADRWDIREGVTRQFWLTYHAAEDLPPGRYRGQLDIRPQHGQPTTLDLELEVLPFQLQRPTQLAVGMTYFSPVQYSYFGAQRFWDRIASEFADMRAHNMTSVQYTGLRMDDYARIGRAFERYREAGFEQPVYLLESYGLLSRMRRNGASWESDAFDGPYVSLVRDFLQQADTRGWPPVVINFGDEFTNSASEKIGARLARSLKTIPGIVTGADANGYLELELLAPLVDVLSFNNGWDGPDGVNQGRHLLNRETVEFVRHAGATPWLVNIGMDRFSNGYWLWKMARLGIRGKMEWIYRAYNGMPYNSFDAQPLRGHAAYPGPGGTTVPAIDYELMRIGLDDLAYLYTLEQVLEAARESSDKQAAVERTDAFISRLDAMLEDDMDKYRDAETRKQYAWPMARFDEIRGEVVDLVLQLRD